MLNEFRGFLDLTFEEWDPDKDVVAANRKSIGMEKLEQVMNGARLYPYVSFSFVLYLR